MKGEQRDCASRASSTSSLGREVRCGCQFYRSNSLLPERRAHMSKPRSRFNIMQTLPPYTKVPHSSCHEYEPIAPRPPVTVARMVAPVVRIADTDVMPVADSDDSIDEQARIQLRSNLDIDIILPLDGRLEDNAMESCEFKESIDTSDEKDFISLSQDQINEDYIIPSDLGIGVRLERDSKITQADSSGQEESSMKSDSHSFQKRLSIQAQKLRHRLKRIHNDFKAPSIEKKKKVTKIKNNKPTLTESNNDKSSSRIKRFKMSLPDRSKFKIKHPDIHLPSRFIRYGKNIPSSEDAQRKCSRESAYGSCKNILDFSTYPRFFHKKTNCRTEYATSSPKESPPPQSTDNATFPRIKKNLRDRWARQFGDDKLLYEDTIERMVAVERSRPWKRPSLEEPQLAFPKKSSELHETSGKLPWESADRESIKHEEEIQYADDDSQGALDENSRITLGSYKDQKVYEETVDSESITETESADVSSRARSEPGVRMMENNHQEYLRSVKLRFPDEQIPSEDNSPVRSDEEESGSDRQLDSLNESLYEGEFSPRDLMIEMYMREGMNGTYGLSGNALADEDMMFTPPKRPNRTKSLRKVDTDSVYSRSDLSPVKPERNRFSRSNDEFIENRERTGTDDSGHIIVYRAETTSLEPSATEPLDDIIVVKPLRRKSKSIYSNRSEPVVNSSRMTFVDATSDTDPPLAPARKKNNGKQLEYQVPYGPTYVVCKEHDGLVQRPGLEERRIDHPPIPKMRKSRSRTVSSLQDEDRTSHGAESLSEIGYIDEIPPDFSREPSHDYATIDKREKFSAPNTSSSLSSAPPSPPPRRHRYSANPTVPKRPRRTYSTLAPLRKTSTNVTSISSDNLPQYARLNTNQVTRNMSSEELLSKIQGRPLPAPPRPPRPTKEILKDPRLKSTESVNGALAHSQLEHSLECSSIEEEITQGKLIMKSTKSGSQVHISTERITTPILSHTPPIPSLSVMQDSELMDQSAGESIPNESEPMESEVGLIKDLRNQLDVIRSALLSGEALRIDNLEVRDLRVDHLNASKLECSQVIASEIEAVIINASEFSGRKILAECRADPLPTHEIESAPQETINTLNIESIQDVDPHTLDSQGSGRMVEASVSEQTISPLGENSRIQDKLDDELVPERSQESKFEEPDILAMVIVGNHEKGRSRSRSRSSSTSRDCHLVRQSASPVRSLPPAISVTLDTPDGSVSNHICADPERAIISYIGEETECRPDMTQSRIENHAQMPQFVTVQTPQMTVAAVPLAPSTLAIQIEPSLTETMQQLLRALGIVSTRSMKEFINYLTKKITRKDTENKVRDMELILCALLLIIAGILTMIFLSPRTIIHHHHWDYFNPPQQ